MKALLLSEEAKELLKGFKEISVASILKNIPYDLGWVEGEFRAGFRPEKNIFFTTESVKLVEGDERIRDMALAGPVAVNFFVKKYLEGKGVKAEFVPKDRIGKYVRKLNVPFAVWCSSEEDVPEVPPFGKVFAIYSIEGDEEGFRKVVKGISEGAYYLIFVRPEEVYAWERLEEAYGEAEGLWAIAMGKELGMLIQRRTSLSKVLIFEEGAEEFPRFLRLFGIE